MKRKIGLSTLGFQNEYGDKKAIEMAVRAGADSIDFFLGKQPYEDGSVYLGGDAAVVDYYCKLKEYAHSLGLEINQTHGYGAGFCGDAQKDAVATEKYRLDCLATAALGAEVMVIHNVGYGEFLTDERPEFIRDLNHELYMTILPFAKKYGIKIASETLANSGQRIDFFGNTDEFIAACEKIESGEYKDYFTVCMDTGHSHKAVRYGFESVPDMIRRLGSRITVLHIHDNDGIKDQHRMPPHGTIDWQSVFEALSDIGFDGVYNLELSLTRYGKELMEDHAAFAIKVLRNMLK